MFEKLKSNFLNFFKVRGNDAPAAEPRFDDRVYDDLEDAGDDLEDASDDLEDAGDDLEDAGDDRGYAGDGEADALLEQKTAEPLYADHEDAGDDESLENVSDTGAVGVITDEEFTERVVNGSTIAELTELVLAMPADRQENAYEIIREWTKKRRAPQQEHEFDNFYGGAPDHGRSVVLAAALVCATVAASVFGAV